MTTDESPREPGLREIAIVLVFLIGALGWAMLFSPAAAAQSTPSNISKKAPFYNDTNVSKEVANESWMQNRSEPTLDNMTHYLTRLQGFVVGVDTGDTGGVGAAGALLTGLLVMGFAIALTPGARIGFVGGGVLGVLAVSGLVEAGLAPGWTYVIVLGAVGLVAATVVLRAMR